MGTTQRLSPGVKGQPNWGSLNQSVTQVAKTVEQEEKDERDAISQDQAKIDKAYKKLNERRTYHLKATFNNLVKTGGGSKAISTGKSTSIGRAGLTSSGKFVRFFSQVSSSGLQPALRDIGFGNLTGKSVQDIVDYLLVYCSDSNTGMDETAANKASCEVLNDLAIQAQNDLTAFESLLKELVEGTGMADLICSFWGHYIFEHLSQRFQEKITQERGAEVSNTTFKIIKEDILLQVKVLNTSRPVAKIEWKGKEGKTEIERIFESIIKIISN
jgi:hypothetical protein